MELNEQLMKIAIVTETFHPATDGVVTRLTETIRWLRKHGHDILVIAPDRGITEYEGAAVCGIPSFRFFLYPDMRMALPRPKVGRVLSEFNPDVVHVVNPAVLGVAGIWYGRRWPLVASYHTNVPAYADYYKLPWLKPVLWSYLRLLHNQADMNVCTSQSVLEELRARGFRNVHLWKRGVNLELFRPERSSLKMRSRLSGGEPDKRLLLYVGRLAAEKQIEKIRDVLYASDDYRLAIIGDGPHRPALEKHFAGTKTVFTGFLHGEELAAAFASSDLFVFPSTTETLGLVLLEAMASGLPCLAADSGPTREQIQHGVNGFLYDPRDPLSLTKTVNAVWSDPMKLRQAGLGAINTARSLGWEAASEQIIGCYEAVIRLRSSIGSSQSRMKEKDA